MWSYSRFVVMIACLEESIGVFFVHFINLKGSCLIRGELNQSSWYRPDTVPQCGIGEDFLACL